MVKIAAIQMSSTDSISDNLKYAAQLINEAADKGVQLVGLPEGFCLYGVNNEKKIQHAETFGFGVVQDYLANIALKNKIWILGGAFLIKETDGRIYITSLVYNSSGECVAKYHKIHLFKAFLNNNEYNEANFASPGRDYVVISTPFGRLGLSICFDLRFPLVYHKLSQLGAEIIAAPSAFTYVTGKMHWEILLRCRAIDSFSYIFAPAQYGIHVNGFRTYGHAMIVNPRGEIIAEMQEEKGGFITADIDLREVYQIRKRIIK